MSQIQTSLDVNGMSEHIDLFTPDAPNGSGIIFTHGWTANSSGYHELAQACADQGATSLAVDLLSHGQSTGNREDLTINDYVNGLTVAYDHLAAQPAVDQDRIGLMAGSFGAYVGVLLSAHRPVESLLLRVPAIYGDGLRDLPRREFNTDDVLEMVPSHRNEALKLVHQFVGRVILVSSENDEVIKSHTIEAYSQAISNGEHIVMAGATHVLDQPNRKLFIKLLLDWASKL